MESYIDNDASLHKKWQGVVRNMKRHQGKGDYDTEIAIDGFMTVVDAAAKQYVKEFKIAGNWYETFNAPTRQSVAVSFVDSFEHGRRDEDKMLNPRGYKQGGLRGSTLGAGKDWHLVIDGPHGNFSTTAWRTKKEAEAEGKSVVAELNEYKPRQYHYRVEYVGAKSNPGRRHMACGDLSKKRCDQLNAVYESSRARGYSKKRSAQQARGVVRKQLKRDKKKGRKRNPERTAAATTTTPQIRALADRLVRGD